MSFKPGQNKDNAPLEKQVGLRANERNKGAGTHYYLIVQNVRSKETFVSSTFTLRYVYRYRQVRYAR